jgi:membrane-bound ClpP family serine protease
MLGAYSTKTKISLLVLLFECATACSIIVFLDLETLGTFYDRLVIVCIWMAVILPITLGFLYSALRQVSYPFVLSIAMALGIFFYDFFMPTMMSIGIPLALFNLSVVLPFILLSPRRSAGVSKKTILIGFLISTIYVFGYSYFHYGLIVNPDAKKSNASSSNSEFQHTNMINGV